MRAQEQRPRQARKDDFGRGENIAAYGEPHHIFVILSEVAAGFDRRAFRAGGHGVEESLCGFLVADFPLGARRIPSRLKECRR